MLNNRSDDVTPHPELTQTTALENQSRASGFVLGSLPAIECSFAKYFDIPDR